MDLPLVSSRTLQNLANLLLASLAVKPFPDAAELGTLAGRLEALAVNQLAYRDKLATILG
jgi:hypothetical protein